MGWRCPHCDNREVEATFVTCRKGSAGWLYVYRCSAGALFTVTFKTTPILADPASEVTPG